MRNFTEVFRKDASYDNLKSHKKQDFTLSLSLSLSLYKTQIVEKLALALALKFALVFYGFLVFGNMLSYQLPNLSVVQVYFSVLEQFFV